MHHISRRVRSVVEHSSANQKVPSSIPGPVSYQVEATTEKRAVVLGQGGL